MARLSEIGWSAPPLRQAALPAILMVSAVGAGGTATGHYFQAMLVQIVAVLTITAVAAGMLGRSFPTDARLPLFLVALLALLMLAQLVPLPFAWWSALPGREGAAQTLALLGANGVARPLSLDPERTMLSALALLPGIAMLVATLAMPSRARVMLAWIVILLALVSLVLGAAQSALGANAASLTLYATSHVGMPLGFFANINHQADLLLIGFLLTAAMMPPRDSADARRGAYRLWILALLATFAIAIIVAGSRAAIALLAVAIVAVLARNRIAGHARLYLVGGLAVIVALVLLVALNPIVATSFSDFSNVDDPRFLYWPNVLYAIGVFGWAGSGAGTFDGVYRSVETLDTMGRNFVNHAHNDYLEIVLETGVAGAVLLAAFLAFVGWRAVAVLRRTELGAGRALAYAALTAIGMLLLHSIVDYPLRTPALSTVFGFLCGLIVTSPTIHDAPAIPHPDDNGDAASFAD